MPLFVKFAYWEAVLLFGGFLGVVLWMLLTGSIPLSYLRILERAASGRLHCGQTI